MLSIFELSRRKQGSCLVYMRGISECNISCLSPHLEFIFRVPNRNTLIKNGQDQKWQMKFHLNLWLSPFKLVDICLQLYIDLCIIALYTGIIALCFTVIFHSLSKISYELTSKQKNPCVIKASTKSDSHNALY
jgi:hypothetical protein